MAPSPEPEHGPALVYISSSGLDGTQTIARVDLNAVETPRERALCRALLHHALTLLDDAENPLHTLTRDIAALNEVALERRTAPLVVDPPDWWEPYRKPTRDQLLDAADRVRALHSDWEADPGHCTHCQDGMGSPLAWPCPTIQALGEEAT